MSNTPDPASYVPGYQVATQKILEYIDVNGLKVGDRLPTERQLAEIFGVSHTVAREAVKVLSALGRVSVRKRAGLFVAEPDTKNVLRPDDLFLPSDPGQVRQLFEYRSLIEGEAAKRAAAHATPPELAAIRGSAMDSLSAARDDDFPTFREADERFHQNVAVASGNMFLSGAASTINGLKKDVLQIGLRNSASGSMIEAAEQHCKIGEAIADGDETLAFELAIEHITIAKNQYLSRIASIFSSMRA